MEEDIRWKQRFANFENAFCSLKDILEQKDIAEDVRIDAAIKRFELTFELAWKTLQDYLQAQGYAEYKGPAKILAKSFQDGLIEDNELWGLMHEDRNILTHVYDYDKSRMIYKNIAGSYIVALAKFYNKFKYE